jgi:GNAT superfamily N-acetyltransferase
MNEKTIGSIQIRNISDADVGFVFNSWLKSYRNSNFSRDIPNSIYFGSHHKLIERLISRSEVKIACNAEDAGQIYGYIVAEKVQGILTLHYMYVKHTYRNMGIGKVLLNQFEWDFSTAGCYTHETKIVSRLAAKYNLAYHPYLLMELFNKEEPNAAAIPRISDQRADSARQDSGSQESFED